MKKVNVILFVVMILTGVVMLFSCTAELHAEISPYEGMMTRTIAAEYSRSIDSLLYRDGLYWFVETVGSESSAYICTFNPDTGAITKEKLPFTVEGTLSHFALTDTGYAVILNMAVSFNAPADYRLYYFENGVQVWEKKLDTIFGVAEGDSLQTIHLSGNGDTLLITLEQNGIWLKADDPGKVSEFTLPDRPTQIMACPDGTIRLFCYSASREYLFDRETAIVSYLKVFDPDKGTFTDNNALLQEGSQWGAYEYYPGSEYDLYYRNDNGLYGYNAGESPVLLINWVTSGIYINSMHALAVHPNGRFLISETMGESIWDETTLSWFSPAVSESTRQIVKVSYVNYSGVSEIPGAAIAFNSSQDTYLVICEEYESANGAGAYATMLTGLDKAILDGSLGDLVMLESEEDVLKYGNKGVFADLYQWINEKEIFNCIRELYETDGSLYALPQKFSVYSFLTDEGYTADDWTIEAFLSLAEENSNERLTALSGTLLQDIFTDCVLASFVNLKNRTCDFSSPAFSDIMEYLKQTQNDTLAEGAYEPSSYISDRIRLYRDVIVRFSDYIQASVFYGPNADVQWLGYPTAEGGKMKVQAQNPYAITANSNVKEGAWAFLSFLLSGDRVDFNDRMSGFPVLRETLADWFAIEEGQYYHIGVDGGVSAGGKSEPKEGDILVLQADDAMYNEILSWLDNISALLAIPKAIRDIFTEELSVYLSGTRSAEETAQIMQSRMQLYLNEQG